jgi:ferrous iron transport protein A
MVIIPEVLEPVRQTPSDEGLNMTADTVMLRTLDQLLPGQTATIQQIGGRGSFRRRVMDLGLINGAEIKMIQANPLGDPIEYAVDGYHLTLRRAEARVIVVSL